MKLVYYFLVLNLIVCNKIEIIGVWGSNTFGAIKAEPVSKPHALTILQQRTLKHV